MTSKRITGSRAWPAVLACGFLTLFLSEPARTSAQVRRSGNLISIKISGGYEWISGGAGEIDAFRTKLIDYYTSFGQLAGYSGQASWGKIQRVPGFAIELTLHPLRNFALAVGTSYTMADSTGTYGFGYHAEGSLPTESYVFDQTVTTTRTFSVRAIPLMITLYGILPLDRTFGLYAFAGVGYYSGRTKQDISEQTLIQNQHTPLSPGTPVTRDETTINDQVADDVEQQSFGLHGGLGLEIKVADWLSLNIEGYGRSLSFSGWEGIRQETVTTRQRFYQEGAGWTSDQTTSDFSQIAGSLYYYELMDKKLGKPYPSLELTAVNPDSATYQNVHQPSFDLSGFGLRLGLRFYFTID